MALEDDDLRPNAWGAHRSPVRVLRRGLLKS